jgi:hypothetical protein
MNRAVVATLIFVSVAAFVSLHAWLLHRRTSRALDRAVAEATEGAPRWPHASAPPYTPLQWRIYFASLAVSAASIIAGAVLAGVQDEPSKLSYALVALAVALVYVRMVAFRLARKAWRRQGHSLPWPTTMPVNSRLQRTVAARSARIAADEPQVVKQTQVFLRCCGSFR